MIWIDFYRQNKVWKCMFSFPIMFLKNEDTFYSTECLLRMIHAEAMNFSKPYKFRIKSKMEQDPDELSHSKGKIRDIGSSVEYRNKGDDKKWNLGKILKIYFIKFSVLQSFLTAFNWQKSFLSPKDKKSHTHTHTHTHTHIYVSQLNHQLEYPDIWVPSDMW